MNQTEINKPLYMRLYQKIVEEIETGKYVIGDKLPSIRQMSTEQRLNKATVIRAYQVLEQRGFVIKRRGSGTFIAKRSSQTAAPLGLKTIDINRQRIAFDFTSTTPSPELFPVNKFKSALNDVMDNERGAAFMIDDSRGHLGLRQAICQYILKPEHMTESPECVQILTGAQQGIDVIAKALINFGDVVLVESPTYSGALTIFRQRGAQIVSVPMTSSGPDVLSFRAAVLQYRPKLIYVMPRLNNPTGVSYSESAKLELLRLSNKYAIPILESDVSSELSFNGHHTSLKAIMNSEHVFYLKSFSKSVMPGLRLGFVTMPLKYQNDIIYAKATTDIATSGLTQRAFEQFIRCGAYQEQVEHLKRAIYQKYQVAVASYRRYLSEYTELYSENGGLSLWLKIKRTDLCLLFFDQLKQSGIAVVEGRMFDPDSAGIPYFRLSYVALTKEEIIEGINQLGQILTDLYLRW